MLRHLQCWIPIWFDTTLSLKLYDRSKELWTHVSETRYLSSNYITFPILYLVPISHSNSLGTFPWCRLTCLFSLDILHNDSHIHQYSIGRKNGDRKRPRSLFYDTAFAWMRRLFCYVTTFVILCYFVDSQRDSRYSNCLLFNFLIQTLLPVSKSGSVAFSAPFYIHNHPNVHSRRRPNFKQVW